MIREGREAHEADSFSRSLRACVDLSAFFLHPSALKELAP